MSFKKWNRRRWWYKFYAYAYWYCKKKEGVFYMAHTCPVCGMTCHCNGDIDDICLDLEEDILACTHCPDDEDDFEEDFWEDE